MHHRFFILIFPFLVNDENQLYWPLSSAAQYLALNYKDYEEKSLYWFINQWYNVEKSRIPTIFPGIEDPVPRIFNDKDTLAFLMNTPIAEIFWCYSAPDYASMYDFVQRIRYLDENQASREWRTRVASYVTVDKSAPYYNKLQTL